MVKAGRVAIVPRGEYVHGAQYTRLDLVKYEGGVYLAKKNNVSEYPVIEDDNEYWMFMVSADFSSSVESVNGQTGAIELTAEDVGAVSKTGDTMTGELAVPQLVDSGLTSNMAVIANKSKQLESSVVTATELEYLHGVTSPIQTQMENLSDKIVEVSDSVPKLRIDGDTLYIDFEK